MSSTSNHHESEPTPIAPEATETLEHSAPEPATRQERRTLEFLHEAYGDAFQAYLAHIWDGTPIDQIEDEFRNLYWASYPDRKTYIDSVIDGLGWQESYDGLVTRTGMPPEILNWNYPLLLARLQEDRELIDLGGNVHVFLK